MTLKEDCIALESEAWKAWRAENINILRCGGKIGTDMKRDGTSEEWAELGGKRWIRYLPPTRAWVRACVRAGQSKEKTDG